jgi:dihydrofolate reductase
MFRKLVYYVACTIDGFIARDDGSFDWAPSQGEHFADLVQRFPETFPAHIRQAFGVPPHPRRFDTVLMGRTTYEVGLNEGITNPYAPLRQFVVSRSLPDTVDSAVHVYRGSPIALVRQLKAERGKDIWLCGGGRLAGCVFTEIDELILKVNPVLIGSGVPLFAGAVGTQQATLVEHQSYPNGFVLARYDLARTSRPSERRAALTRARGTSSSKTAVSRSPPSLQDKSQASSGRIPSGSQDSRQAQLHRGRGRLRPCHPTTKAAAVAAAISLSLALTASAQSPPPRQEPSRPAPSGHSEATATSPKRTNHGV